MKDYLIETERLWLRKLIPTDAWDFYQLNADPQVIRYTGDTPFENEDTARDFLTNYSHYKEYGYGRWAVVHKTSGQFIGWCGLKFNEIEEVDLGFRFHRKHWGKGYATESARASIEYGFEELGLNRIMGRAVTENIASVKVLQKIGMRYWKKDLCEHFEDASYYLIEKNQH